MNLHTSADNLAANNWNIEASQYTNSQLVPTIIFNIHHD